MPKFEQQFVHAMWDDELEGKKGFFANDIRSLLFFVENNFEGQKGTITHNSKFINSFDNKEWASSGYKFCYYDPYYEMKLAHEQGKVIQFHELNDDWDEWLDCENEPDWGYPPERYRIKPDEHWDVLTLIQERDKAQARLQAILDCRLRASNGCGNTDCVMIKSEVDE